MEKVKAWGRLYREYKILHDCFVRGGNGVMERIKDIKKQAIVYKG